MICSRLLAALAIAACVPAARAGDPAPAPKFHHGIDVSGHSGAVDWARLLEDGHTFAFTKATEGMDLKDPAFDANWASMKAAGIIRGAYHFYVSEDDPEKQARFFIATVSLEPGDLAPVVDVETLGHDTSAGLGERVRRFIALVEEHYGVKPIIYTTARFWDDRVGDADLGDYPLWVAEYDVESPRLPGGWSSWHLWQWQQDVVVPGVEKNADVSHFNSAEQDIAALTVPTRRQLMRSGPVPRPPP